MCVVVCMLSYVKTNRYLGVQELYISMQYQDTSDDEDGNLKFIFNESDEWNKQTIHIKFPAMEPKEDDVSFVAWCRTDAEGDLVGKSNLPDMEGDNASGYKFCKPCCRKAEESDFDIEDICSNLDDDE